MRVAATPRATLLATRPRALPASVDGLLRDACASFAPHAGFAQAPTRERDRVRTVARIGDERLELGVVARGRVCLVYLLASRPDAVPDPAGLIDRDLATAISPFDHWLD